jgi:hypothetical protein
MAASGRNILTAVLTALLLGTPAPVLADSAIEGLANANKTYQDGNAAKALEQIKEVFASKKMDNDTTAKALLLRGQIYEKVGKPALAYADYNNAIWLGGLTAAERNRASEGRRRVQAALGAGGDSSHASRGASGAPAKTASRSSGGFLSGLFGGGSSERRPRRAPKPAPGGWAPQESPGKKANPAASPAGARKTAAAWRPSHARPAAAETGGGKSYYSQFAAARSEKKALSEAKRLARKLRNSLGGRPVLVVRTEAARGKPALYRVVTGPLADKSEARKLCGTLKRKGARCLVYAP